MGAPIRDEFFGSGMCRQQVWMLRRMRDGLCRVCGQPRVDGNASHCEKHRRGVNAYKARWLAARQP
jgi:hypothetical protein